MPKAILELEMPESCWGCPLQAISEKKIKYCTVIRYSTDYYGTKRRENCPLKPVERRLNNVRLSDLLTAFKGCDKVIFRLTGCGEQEHETAEFKDAIEAIEALQQENEQLRAQVKYFTNKK